MRLLQSRPPKSSRHRCSCAVLGALLGVFVLSEAVWAQGKISLEIIEKKDDLLERDRREKAEKKAEEVRQQKEAVGKLIVEHRRQIASMFEMDSRGMLGRPERVSKYLQDLKQRRDAVKFSLLEHRDQSRGAIVSGRALNFFLQECGPIAYDHQFRKSLSSKTLAGYELMQQVAMGTVFSPDETARVNVESGLVGNKLAGKLNQQFAQSVQIDWPRVLRRDEYKSHRDEIEGIRDQALKEIRENRAVSTKTSDKLLKAVEKLAKRSVHETKANWVKGDYGRSAPYLEAERFSAKLSQTAFRLLEAESEADVTIPRFKEGNVEELLAHMYRHNLRFAPADANGQTTYFIIYEMMSRYYVDLVGLRDAIKAEEAEFARLAKREEELVETALGNRMSAMQQVELGKSLLETVKAAFEAVD